MAGLQTRRRFPGLRSLAWLSLLAWVASLGAAEENRFSSAAVETRLTDSIRYLAGDELQGRGVGTPGIEQAAQFIAEQFAAAGLKTDALDGKPYQSFSMTVGTEMGPTNTAALVGPPGADGKPQRIELKLGEDFNPLSIGGSGKIDVPLDFLGYGITAKDLKYDDYAGIEVEKHAAIVLRHEPEQANPHSAFNGTQHSQYAPFTRKVSNAYEHGVSAVLFLTDDYEIQQRVAQRLTVLNKSIDELAALREKFGKLKDPTLAQVEEYRAELDKQLGDSWQKDLRDQMDKLQAEYDPLIGFRGAGSSDTGRIPVLHVRRAPIERMIRAALDTSLARLEEQIDEGPKPRSQPLKVWRLQAEITVERKQADVKNVIAVLPGEGPKADETIIVGAHYDHLGTGGEGSLAPGSKEVHNGADDNGSGTVTLLEAARQLAARPNKLPRRVVFIAFTGEERGLLGSAYYCSHPVVPLDKTIAMLNMDMVGRLKDDKLIVQGCDTAAELGTLLDRVNERMGFKITRQPGGFGPSDHSTFYGKKIPVLHFFTGTHSDYHRPTDDVEKLNIPGMRRVAEMVSEMVVLLAEADAPPVYKEVKSSRPQGAKGGDRPYFGSIPDFAQDKPGYKLSGVTDGGPAKKAGLQAGDIIIKLGDSRIGNLEDFDSALRKYKAGDKVPVVVDRDGKEVTLPVTLDPPR